jgi:type II secretory pathway predicted ATPase ExeA
MASKLRKCSLSLNSGCPTKISASGDNESTLKLRLSVFLDNLNFKEDSMSPLSLIVVGQPSLRNLLKVKQLEAIEQRIQMRYQMSGLTEKETIDYIRHQLKVVETPHEIFSEEAIQAIYNFSQGIPRKINTLCSQSLNASPPFKI